MPSWTEQQYEQVREILGITPGEPIFVLRAQDELSTPTIDEYHYLAEDNGRPEEFVDAIRGYERDKETGKHKRPRVEIEDTVFDRFVKWQREHPEKVKLPD